MGALLILPCLYTNDLALQVGIAILVDWLMLAKSVLCRRHLIIHRLDKLMPNSYTQEAQFQYAMQHDIAPCWQSRQQGYHLTLDNKRLYWCSLTAAQHNKVIVIVNGRIESACKYQELFYDLFHQGYDIYSFDHRGQGLSERLIADPQMGYVEQFDDYVRDMDELITRFPLQNYTQRYLLAHSMGGAITTRYLESYPNHPFDAVVLSAPMLGINMPWQLRPIAFTLTKLLSATYATPHYAPGYGAYLPKPFATNQLTHSAVRYQWFRELYEQQPQLKLGGPSAHWVWQSLLAIKRCFTEMKSIRLPLLLLQAGQDTIVSNHAQTRFMTQLARTNPQAKIEIIDGARHELLFESDHYRTPVLDKILAFFAQHSQ